MGVLLATLAIASTESVSSCKCLIVFQSDNLRHHKESYGIFECWKVHATKDSRRNESLAIFQIPPKTSLGWANPLRKQHSFQATQSKRNLILSPEISTFFRFIFTYNKATPTPTQKTVTKLVRHQVLHCTATAVGLPQRPLEDMQTWPRNHN